MPSPTGLILQLVPVVLIAIAARLFLAPFPAAFLVVVITYKCTDGQGRPALDASRKVVVKDTIPPVITRVGEPLVLMSLLSVSSLLPPSS
jgi:hypothetical protein